jgi:hypothetical protein
MLGAQAQPGAAAAQKPEELNSDATALRGNLQVLQYVNALLFIVAGLAAGVVGLEGFAGFAAYAVTHAVLIALILVASGFDTHAYFLQQPHMLLLGGLWAQLTPFLLFWALGYSVVHVF